MDILIITIAVSALMAYLNKRKGRATKDSTEERFIVRFPTFGNVIIGIGVLLFLSLLILCYIQDGYKIKFVLIYVIGGVPLLFFLAGLIEGGLRVYVNEDDVLQKVLFVIPRRKFKIQELEKVVMDKHGSLILYKDGKKLFKMDRYCDNLLRFKKTASDNGVPIFYIEKGKMMTEEEWICQDPHAYFQKYGKHLEDEIKKEKLVVEKEFIVKTTAIASILIISGIIGMCGLFLVCFVQDHYQIKDVKFYIMLTVAILFLFSMLAEEEVRLYVNGNDVRQKIFGIIPRRKFKIQELEKIIVDEKGTWIFYQDEMKIFKISPYFHNASSLWQLIKDKEIPVFYKKDGKLMTEEEYLKQNENNDMF